MRRCSSISTRCACRLGLIICLVSCCFCMSTIICGCCIWFFLVLMVCRLTCCRFTGRTLVTWLTLLVVTCLCTIVFMGL